MRCLVCNSLMKELFHPKYYCPNDCDKKAISTLTEKEVEGIFGESVVPAYTKFTFYVYVSGDMSATPILHFIQDKMVIHAIPIKNNFQSGIIQLDNKYTNKEIIGRMSQMGTICKSEYPFHVPTNYHNTTAHFAFTL